MVPLWLLPICTAICCLRGMMARAISKKAFRWRGVRRVGVAR
jgi:hypothetical protein